MNHFIHHPTIQNNRQRGDTHTSSGIDEGIVMHHVNSGGGGGGGDGLSNNIHDNEQFPLLTSKTGSGSGSASLKSSEPNVTVTKLNFKEMVMKNSKPSVTTEEETIVNNRRDDVLFVPKVRTEYAQKALSSRNIFLGAFYGSSNGNGGDYDGDGDGDGDDYDGDVDKNNAHTPISSILIDSCDRKYDNLYK